MGKSTLAKLSTALKNAASAPWRLVQVLWIMAWCAVLTIIAVPFALVLLCATVSPDATEEFLKDYAPIGMFKWGFMKSLPEFVGRGSFKFLLGYLLGVTTKLTFHVTTWLIAIALATFATGLYGTTLLVTWGETDGQVTQRLHEVWGKIFSKDTYKRKLKHIFKG